MTTNVSERQGWIPDATAFGARLALVRQHMGWGNLDEVLGANDRETRPTAPGRVAVGRVSARGHDYPRAARMSLAHCAVPVREDSQR